MEVGCDQVGAEEGVGPEGLPGRGFVRACELDQNLLDSPLFAVTEDLLDFPHFFPGSRSGER